MLASWNLPRNAKVETLICFALFAALLEFNFRASIYLLVPFLAVAVVAPKYRLVLIAVSNVVGLAITPLFLPGYVVAKPIMEMGFFLAMNIGVLTLFYIYAHLSITWSRAVAISVLIGLVSAVICFLSTNNYVGRTLSGDLLQGLFFNCYFLRVRSQRKQLGLIPFLANQHPYYYRTIIPFPPLVGDKIAAQTKFSLEDLVGLRWRALFILALGFLAQYGIELSRPHLARWYGLDPMTSMEVAHPLAVVVSWRQLLQPDLTTWTHWQLVLINFGGRVVRVFETAAAPVAICRMLGADARSSVYDVFGAKSMSQFFERTNHYYARVLTDLFVYPISRALDIVRRPKLLTATICLGILVGGVVIHHMIVYLLLVAHLQTFYPRDLWSPAIYWLVMAVLVSGSIYFERMSSRRNIGYFEWAARWWIYFATSGVAFLFILEYYSNAAPMSGRLAFIASLFGL